METCGHFTGASDVFSTVSLCSWICAQMPQIYTNYKNKSADGISVGFLVLWFAGDFLSFTSCLLNEVVLKFQVYLSLFFICNDIMLCWQYYYYRDSTAGYRSVTHHTTNLDFDDTSLNVSLFHHDVETHITDGSHRAIPTPEMMTHSPSGSYSSTDNLPTTKATVVSAIIKGADATKASKASEVSTRSARNFNDGLGFVLAWAATVVYMASRCPQLYKNYQRKSVDGISPLLFGAALLGNLTYTLSILTSCAFVDAASRRQFFVKELPYILGSAGTIVFDAAYFYQRHIYRKPVEAPIGLTAWNSS